MFSGVKVKHILKVDCVLFEKLAPLSVCNFFVVLVYLINIFILTLRGSLRCKGSALLMC